VHGLQARIDAGHDLVDGLLQAVVRQVAVAGAEQPVEKAHGVRV